MKLRFGKYRGAELASVPDDYLYWLLRASRELIVELENELDEPHEAHSNGNGHHYSAPPNLPPLTKQLVEVGFKTLAKKYHADVNGGRTDEKMVELNLAMEQLRKVFK
jgi:hypothetical protein